MVILIQPRLHQDQGGKAAGDFGNVAGFLHAQVAAQQVFLAVGEPFLDDLVAADVEFPYCNGDTAPIPWKFSLSNTYTTFLRCDSYTHRLCYG